MVADAAKVLVVVTDGTFDLDRLCGDRNARCRSIVMGALLDRKVPQSKAGFNALRDALYSAGSIAGDCIRNREIAFEAWIRAEYRKTIAA